MQVGNLILKAVNGSTQSVPVRPGLKFSVKDVSHGRARLKRVETAEDTAGRLGHAAFGLDLPVRAVGRVLPDEARLRQRVGGQDFR